MYWLVLGAKILTSKLGLNLINFVLLNQDKIIALRTIIKEGKGGEGLVAFQIKICFIQTL